jgi:transposase
MKEEPMSEAELVVLTRPERIYLGVDVGRRHHVVSAVARSTFEEGGVRWQSAPTLKAEVNRTGFERIAALVAKLRTDERVEVVAGVEPTGGYYARTVHAFLGSLGVEVHWVKNAAVHDARDAVYGRKTKTDPVDARLIARLLYLRDAVGQEYAFSTGYDQIGAYATLRLLVGNRWRLRQAQARAGNQLTQILDVVFPEMAEVFAKTASSDAALRLLDRYPTPKAVAEAGRDEVYRIVVFEARAPRKAPMVPKLIELAEHSVGIAGGIDDVIAAERYLVGQLLRLDEEVAAIEERIVQTLAMVPEGEIICSFPAAKEMRAATILGAMGAPVAAFRSDKALRRHLGWSVEEERSGSSVVKERLSRSGNRHSRREMRLWTLGLISPRTPWTPFKAHYDRLVAPPNAKRPNVALGHLASKLISVMYACMVRNEAYDEKRLAKDMGIEIEKRAKA